MRGLFKDLSFFLLLHRLSMQLFFALRAHPLNLDTPSLPGNGHPSRSSVGIWRPHHLLGHPVGFLLVLISGLVDGQLGLDHL